MALGNAAAHSALNEVRRSLAVTAVTTWKKLTRGVTTLFRACALLEVREVHPQRPEWLICARCAAVISCQKTAQIDVIATPTRANLACVTTQDRHAYYSGKLSVKHRSDRRRRGVFPVKEAEMVDCCSRAPAAVGCAGSWWRGMQSHSRPGGRAGSGRKLGRPLSSRKSCGPLSRRRTLLR